jgi:hypothetical protein
MNTKQILITLGVAASAFAMSCGSETGRAYMPDMAYSRAYEFYSDDTFFANGITAQQPVAGTIARGSVLPDHIGEFDTIAARSNKCNFDITEDNIAEGGRLYAINCGVCHGGNLDGNGPLYNGGSGKYPAAPANFMDTRYLNMPVGTMYHAIMYGKNLMGSYASQLDAKQRWWVLAYIKKMQAEKGGAALNSMFNITSASSTVKSGDTVKIESADGHSKTVIVTEVKSNDNMHTDKAVTKSVEQAVKEASKKK